MYSIYFGLSKIILQINQEFRKFIIKFTLNTVLQDIFPNEKSKNSSCFSFFFFYHVNRYDFASQYCEKKMSKANFYSEEGLSNTTPGMDENQIKK